MEPVHRAIAADPAFDLHLVVTGMHFLPEFASSLVEVRSDRLGTLHEVPTITAEDSARAMVSWIGTAVSGLAGVLDEVKPHILLLQGDRGEMLAGAIAAAHMNIAAVHMSGGDCSGSVDDSVRCAISKLAHFHLTNCDASTARLVAIGEVRERIVEVGEPGLDRLCKMNFIPLETLAIELGLAPDKPFLVAVLHSVTDEAVDAARQMTILLEALEALKLPVVFTYPNSDYGGRAMRDVLESWRGRPFLRIEPNLGSRRYLSLLRHASAIVGNSSSGLFDTPTLKIPAVNIGSRQTGRLRAANVVDVPFGKQAIIDAVRFVMSNVEFRSALAQCSNPYGDGRAAERTVSILKQLRLGPGLTAKWRAERGPFLAVSCDAV
jgi:GDP/UDP-N,N'-diacetylbacillosamine 2-epimerase (hydrolysing)